MRSACASTPPSRPQAHQNPYAAVYQLSRSAVHSSEDNAAGPPRSHAEQRPAGAMGPPPPRATMGPPPPRLARQPGTQGLAFPAPLPCIAPAWLLQAACRLPPAAPSPQDAALAPCLPSPLTAPCCVSVPLALRCSLCRRRRAARHGSLRRRVRRRCAPAQVGLQALARLTHPHAVPRRRRRRGGCRLLLQLPSLDCLLISPCTVSIRSIAEGSRQSRAPTSGGKCVQVAGAAQRGDGATTRFRQVLVRAVVCIAFRTCPAVSKQQCQVLRSPCWTQRLFSSWWLRRCCYRGP